MGTYAFVSVRRSPDVQVHVGTVAEVDRVDIAMTSRNTICQPDNTISIFLRQGSSQLVGEHGLELVRLWQQREFDAHASEEAFV